MQSLVYKLVPGLYSKEMQRREDFYRSTGMRASSSCSDDSVLGEQINDHDQWVSKINFVRRKFNKFFANISLKLAQCHL